MRKREFTNRLSLRGAYLYATELSQQNKIIDRDPYVRFSILYRMIVKKYLRKIRVTLSTGILGHIIFYRSYSDLFRVSIDPRGKLEGDCRRKSPWMTGERKSPRITMLMWIFISSLSMTAPVRSECVPLPDCVAIGYSETSCETQAVKCPFDGTKLYCLPCDSKYQYTCNRVGETGLGNGCKGKYESCTCADNYVSFCDVIFCS